jgi:hypothetical protein
LTTPEALKIWSPVTNYFPSDTSVAGVRGQTMASIVSEVVFCRLSPEDGMLKLKAEAD